MKGAGWMRTSPPPSVTGALPADTGAEADTAGVRQAGQLVYRITFLKRHSPNSAITGEPARESCHRLVGGCVGQWVEITSKVCLPGRFGAC